MTLLQQLIANIKFPSDWNEKLEYASKRKRARRYITSRKVHPNNPPRFTDTPPQVGAATDKFNARGNG